MSVLGREEELARISALLAAAESGQSDRLAVVGDPGSGKSTVLEEAAAHAGEDRWRVVRARGVEWETYLPLAYLTEVLQPLVADLSVLVPAQRKAIAAVTDGGGDRVDPLAIGAAVLTLLAHQATRGPLLVVLDDLHWADDWSVRALAFAARRLTSDKVAVLAATRQLLKPVREWPTMHLSGLPANDAVRLVTATAKLPIASSVANLLAARTAGNPLALIELSHLLSEAQLLGLEPLPDPLPLGVDGLASFGSALSALPEASQRAAAAVAAAGPRAGELLRPTLEALGLRVDDLLPAEEARIVILRGPEVGFRHPMMRSASLEILNVSARREIHAAVANACRSGYPGRYAWHLEQALPGASETVATAWEDAAGTIHGPSGAAVAALEHAALASPPGPLRATRMLRAAQASLAAGRPEACARLLTEIGPNAGATYTEATLLRSATTVWDARRDSVQEDLAHIAEQPPSITAEQALRASIWLVLRKQNLGDLTAADSYATRAGTLADQIGGDWPAQVEPLRAQVALLRGDRTRFRRLTPTTPPARQVLDEQIGAFTTIAQSLAWAEEYERAWETANSIVDQSRRRGVVSLLTYPLSCLGDISWRVGDWPTATAALDEALDLAASTNQPALRGFCFALRGRVAAAMGDESLARDAIASASRMARELESAPIDMYADHALGLLELSVGHITEAVAALERVDTTRRRMGQNEFTVVPYAADLGEAWVLADQRRDASLLADELAAHGFAQQSEWATAAALRIQAMLTDDSHLDMLVSARSKLPANHAPFDRARTCLALGNRLRQARRQREARGPLSEAASLFAALGARPWLERAESLLGTVGDATRRRPAVRGLTGQELRVCRAVAEGHTNREVAAALIMSPKTVEQHLTSAYAKLGVRNRNQLIAQAARGLLRPLE